MFDRKVRALRRGMSIGAVRAEVGKPEAMQIFSSTPPREVTLWYGCWSMAFTAGKLVARTQF